MKGKSEKYEQGKCGIPWAMLKREITIELMMVVPVKLLQQFNTIYSQTYGLLRINF